MPNYPLGILRDHKVTFLNNHLGSVHEFGDPPLKGDLYAHGHTADHKEQSGVPRQSCR